MDMKKALVLLLIVVFVLSGLTITKDLLVQKVVILGASVVLGAPVSIDSFSIGIVNQSVRMSGLKIYNPPGFPRGILLHVASVNLRLRVAALFRGRISVPYAEIDLREMGVLKDKTGKLNVDALKVAKQEKKAKPAKPMPLEIDLLRLSIGKVVSKDYSVSGAEPLVSVYDVNINKSYKNITSAQQLAALIVAEPMKAAGIQGAAIYGVAMLAGVAILPVTVAATFAGRDNVEHVFQASSEEVYSVALGVAQKMGTIVRESRQAGVISADIGGAKVSIKVFSGAGGKGRAVISARKYLLPKPEVAGGVLYSILEKIK